MSPENRQETEPWPLLAEIREAANVTQAELDRRIGRTRGTIAQLESGRSYPPDRETSDAIDRALGRPEGSLWKEAAPARLRRCGEDLVEWHLAELERARGFKLDPYEERVLTALRRIDEVRQGDGIIPLGLAQALEAVVDGPRFDPDRPQDAGPLPDGEVYHLPPNVEATHAGAPLGTQRETAHLRNQLLRTAALVRRG